MSPSNPQGWLQAMQKGQNSFQQGLHTDAVSFFYVATRLAPNKVEGWINLGVSQTESSNYLDALTSLQQAINLSPTMMLAHMAMGDAHRGLGNQEEAIYAYQKALQLQRTPLILNKLACSLRTIGEQARAEALYQQAIQMDPDLTLTRVNLATVQAELLQFDESRKQLNALMKLSLPPQERNEVDSTHLALEQYFRLQPVLENTMLKADLKSLHEILDTTPEEMLLIDEECIHQINRYADSAKNLSFPTELEHFHLPDDWPLIEALFMIPLVGTVTEYRKVKVELATKTKFTGDMLESMNMESTIQAARVSSNDLQDPINAEMHLRHWHALAMANRPEMLPGQFKVTPNLIATNSDQHLTDPHLVTGTLRYFFNNIYNTLPPVLI